MRSSSAATSTRLLLTSLGVRGDAAVVPPAPPTDLRFSKLLKKFCRTPSPPGLPLLRSSCVGRQSPSPGFQGTHLAGSGRGAKAATLARVLDGGRRGPEVGSLSGVGGARDALVQLSLHLRQEGLVVVCRDMGVLDRRIVSGRFDDDFSEGMIGRHGLDVVVEDGDLLFAVPS